MSSKGCEKDSEILNIHQILAFGILRGPLSILLATPTRTMPETRLIESPLRVLVNSLVDLLCLGLPRNKTRYPYPLPKRNTLPLVHAVLNCFGWPKLLKIMGYMWNMFHYFVTMKVLSRLLTIPCNIIEQSILKFVIISFEIMLPKETLTLSMFAPISNWRIYSLIHLMRKCFAGWEVNWTSLMLQTWSRNSIWIHARLEPMTNPWYFSHVVI